LILIEVASAFAATARRHLAIELEHRFRQSSISELVWIDKDLYERGWQLYRDRLDKEWSLVDCTSFVVMQERGITDALTITSSKPPSLSCSNHQHQTLKRKFTTSPSCIT
jgi:hypothetical protein